MNTLLEQRIHNTTISLVQTEEPVSSTLSAVKTKNKTVFAVGKCLDDCYSESDCQIIFKSTDYPKAKEIFDRLVNPHLPRPSFETSGEDKNILSRATASLLALTVFLLTSVLH